MNGPMKTLPILVALTLLWPIPDAIGAQHSPLENDPEPPETTVADPDQAAVPCRTEATDGLTIRDRNSDPSVRIGAQRIVVRFQVTPPDDLRDYVLTDLNRVLARATGIKIEPANDKSDGSNGRKGPARGNLIIATHADDIQAYAIADRLREVVQTHGCWEILVPDSLVRRYRDARQFWNTHSKERQALVAFMSQFEALTARDAVTYDDLLVIDPNPASLIANAKGNPLKSIQILQPSPLAYEMIEGRDGSGKSALQTAVPFLRDGEFGLLFLEFRDGRWVLVPIF